MAKRSAVIAALVFAVLFVVTGAPARAVEVQRVVSPSGIEAWLVEDHSLPIIAVSFSMTGGATTDPAGKEGLANMAAGLLDEGAGDLDSQSFRRRLEDQSIGLSFRASLDDFSGALKTLTRNRDEAFSLLRLALTEPRFDAEPVERIRAQILTGIAASRNDPGDIAQRTFWALNYPGHPYGRESDGEPDTVKAITSDDLHSFVQNRLARATLVIGVAGDIAPADLVNLLDATFGKLPKQAAPFTVAAAEPAAAGQVIVVDQDVPQSTILFGQRGLPRNDPDYYAAYLVNEILGGGGFTSRLYDEVREKRGLAYSVYSYLLPLDHTALWLGAAATKNASVGQSVDVIRSEWARMGKASITADQLDAARDHVNGSFALRFDSTSGIANMLVAIQREHLGIDYIDKRSGYFDAVSLADANRIAAKLLDPKRLSIVIVGKPEGVQASKHLTSG